MPRAAILQAAQPARGQAPHAGNIKNALALVPKVRAAVVPKARLPPRCGGLPSCPAGGGPRLALGALGGVLPPPNPPARLYTEGCLSLPLRASAEGFGVCRRGGAAPGIDPLSAPQLSPQASTRSARPRIGPPTLRCHAHPSSSRARFGVWPKSPAPAALHSRPPFRRFVFPGAWLRGFPWGRAVASRRGDLVPGAFPGPRSAPSRRFFTALHVRWLGEGGLKVARRLSRGVRKEQIYFLPC